VVKRHAKRAPLLHVKDRPMVAVGSGKMHFPTVIGAADAKVLQWLVVELDECATDMLQAVRASCDWLVGRGLASGRRKPGR
jgi:hypothetical protein